MKQETVIVADPKYFDIVESAIPTISDPNLEVSTKKAPSFLKKQFKNLIIDSCIKLDHQFFNHVVKDQKSLFFNEIFKQ